MNFDYNERTQSKNIVLSALWKHKFGIALFTVATVLVLLPFLYSIQPVYKASASIVLKANANKSINIESILGIPGRLSKQRVATEISIIRSKVVAKRVVLELGLHRRLNFLPPEQESIWASFIDKISFEESEMLDADDPEEGIAQAVEIVRGHLQAKIKKGSHVVLLRYDSHNPELAAEIVNKVVDTYININIEAGAQSNRKTSDFIARKLESLRSKLESSERELQDFKEKNQLIDAQGVKGLSNSQLTAVSTQLLEARSKRSDAEAVFLQVKRARSQGIEALQRIPVILNDIAVQTYRQEVNTTKRKLAELKGRYGPKHPKMIQANADFNAASRNLRNQIEAVVNSIGKDYESARINESRLKREMNLTKAEIQSIDQKQHQLNILTREVEANKKLYDELLAKGKKTDVAAEVHTNIANVLDYADVPKEPYKPKILNYVAIIALLSSMLGIIISWLIEVLDNRINDLSELEDKVDVPVYGIVPDIKTKSKEVFSALNLMHSEENLMFSESMRTLRTGLLLSNIDHDQKIVLVTSSAPGEGKSTTAMSLAVAMSKASNVLLIDADLRRPSIAKMLELEASQKGLSQFVANNVKISEAVYKIPGNNLSVLPAGVIPPNPLELISSKKFEEAINSLKSAFDHILIDSPPVLAVSDAMVLAKYVNTLLYVVRAESTSYLAVNRGLNRLATVGTAPAMGVVLNRTNLKSKDKSYEYYGYHEYAGAD